MSRSKIFVGGIERSGTTLLGTSIARKITATVVPEANFKLMMVDGGADLSLSLDRLEKNFRFRLWEQDRTTIEAFAKQGASPYEALVASLEAQLCGCPRHHAIVDHTPDNISNAARLEAAYSPALYLYIFRDPRATILSIMRTDWGYPSVQSATAFWQRRYEEDLAGIEFLQSNVPARFRTVAYEELCHRPDHVIAKAIESKDFEPNGGGRSLVIVPRYTSMQHSRVLGKATNIEGWREALSSTQIRYIERETQHAFFANDYFEMSSKYDEPVLLPDFLIGLRKIQHRIRAHVRRGRLGLSVAEV